MINDEIKEILDKIKEIYDIHEQIIIKHNNADEIKFFLSIKEGKLLLDYITYLQQENQELNDSITWWTNRFNAVQRDYEELKQENERLKKQVSEYQDEIFARDNNWYDMQD